MAVRKFLYVDSNGDYIETAGAYETADYISSSAGAGDAGKPIVLDAGGHIDASMINDADIDHGSIGGLGDDDHTQYILVDGTRAFSGDQSMGGFKLTNVANGTADSDAVNLGQLNSAVNGLDWKPSVRAATTAALPAVTYANGSAGVGATLTADANGALPDQDGVTLVVNDRLLVKDQVAGLQNGIYVVTAVGDGSNPFVLTRATDSDTAAEVTPNMTVQAEEGTTQADYGFQLRTNGAITMGTTALVFGKIFINALVAGDGIDLVGETISVDLLSGGGLKIVSTELAVEPSDFAGDGLVDDGSDNLAIDWAASATDNKAWRASDLNSSSGAGYIGIADSGSYFTGTTVEAALQELGAATVPGVVYTVGAGGVDKGDLLMVSANDTVLPKDVNNANYAIGLAVSTESAAATVKTVAENYVLTGVLSGATAGTRYYWNGTALTTSIPAGSGAYVWLCGVAKNATDLDVHVEFIKKNT